MLDRWPFVFGFFPRCQLWQDFRCWRHTVAYPAIRRWLRRGAPVPLLASVALVLFVVALIAAA